MALCVRWLLVATTIIIACCGFSSCNIMMCMMRLLCIFLVPTFRSAVCLLSIEISKYINRPDFGSDVEREKGGRDARPYFLGGKFCSYDRKP